MFKEPDFDNPEFYTKDDDEFSQDAEDEYDLEIIPEEAERRLEEILLTDDDIQIPEERVRKGDWKWINQNIGLYNRTHPQFKEISKLLKVILADEAIDELLDL
jgi:hypothetical protein